MLIAFEYDATMTLVSLGLPAMREDMLAETVPTGTWHRYGRFEPTSTFYVFRAGRYVDFRTGAMRAEGGTLGFYADDYKLEALWTKSRYYADLLAGQNWGALVAPNFSLWADDPIFKQVWNIGRSRTLARAWQDAGMRVAPDLNWSTEESFAFCFAGIPRGCPVAYCQTRTVRKEDRPAFMLGLAEAVRQVEPLTIVLYGMASWLADQDLPAGPRYVRLDSTVNQEYKSRIRGNPPESAPPSPEPLGSNELQYPAAMIEKVGPG